MPLRASPIHIRNERRAVEVHEALLELEVFAAASADLAVDAARNYRTLRGRGKTVRKTVDVLIATFCLREGHSLLHCDRDFDSFEDLLGLRRRVVASEMGGKAVETHPADILDRCKCGHKWLYS